MTCTWMVRAGCSLPTSRTNGFAGLTWQPGLITTFAGTGEKSRAGDGRPATEASLMGPRAVCMDRLGNAYVAEREGNGVRRISADGTLSTVAGANSVRGYAGDGGPALAAAWGAPKAIRCDLDNNVIVVDTENYRSPANRLPAPAS